MNETRWDRFTWSLGNVEAGWRGVVATLLASAVLIASVGIVIAAIAAAFTANLWLGIGVVAFVILAGFVVCTGSDPW